MRIKEKLQHIIKNSLITLGIEKKTNEIIIESSEENEYDYYTNISISLTKELHKKPEEIAEILKNKIKDELIEKIEIIYPGTMRIYLNKKYILNGLSEIIEKNINYGKNKIGESRKINLDFINDEIYNEIEIPIIFNSIYGDNLSRILKFNGFDVIKEFYLNDTALEIEKLTEKSYKKYADICKSSNLGINIQEKQSMRDTAFDIYKLYGNNKINEKIEYFKKEEISTLFDNKKYELDKYRINFDTYTSEQSLYDKGIVDSILDKLNRNGYTYFNNDELWLKTTDFTDDKDRILIKKDGTYTEVLPLIAYHIDRVNRNYDGIINIYNKSKNENKKMLKPILKMLEQDTKKIDTKVLPNIKIFNEGNEITDIKYIKNKYDINFVRYLFSFKNIKEDIEINLEDIIKSINYIEKINKKIYKILRGYNKKITKVNNFSTIYNKEAYTVLNKLYEFEDIVIISGLKQQPHLICNYLLELAKIFSDYYASEQLITEDEIYTNERLNLLLAIKIVMNNAFNLIGIIPIEEI